MRRFFVILVLACGARATAYFAYTKHAADLAPTVVAPTVEVPASSGAATLTVSTAVKPANHANPQTTAGNAATKQSPDHWHKLYKSAADRFTFVKEAAPAALAGDGRAAWLIGDAINECLPWIDQAHRGKDIAALLQRSLEQQPQGPMMAGIQTEGFERCKKLATEDAFAGLPPRDGGYAQPRYWWDLAVRLNDPGALARNAMEKITNGTMDATQAQAVIDRAVQSQDPMAMFWVGATVANEQYSSNTDHGCAMMLAACDMGYDCSLDNSDLMPIPICKYQFDGECQYHDFPSLAAYKLGPDKYAKVYAESQALKTYLANPNATADALGFVKIYR